MHCSLPLEQADSSIVSLRRVVARPSPSLIYYAMFGRGWDGGGWWRLITTPPRPPFFVAAGGRQCLPVSPSLSLDEKLWTSLPVGAAVVRLVCRLSVTATALVGNPTDLSGARANGPRRSGARQLDTQGILGLEVGGCWELRLR